MEEQESVLTTQNCFRKVNLSLELENIGIRALTSSGMKNLSLSGDWGEKS